MKPLPLRSFLLAALVAFFAQISVMPSAFAKDTPASGVTIVRIEPSYRTDESFDRISEYFTGQENTGGQMVFRTHQDSRQGYYFFTRLKNQEALSGAKVELSVIAPETPEAKTYTFPVPDLPKGSVLLNPGLTGPDWPDANARPVAWRIRLLAADGSEIVTQQSFLWSKS